MQDTQALILNELQALRADYNTHARETGERLSALETSMKALTGNGHPGRITLIEQDVQNVKDRTSKLERWQVWVGGIAVGVSGVFSVIFHFIGRK